MGMCCPKGLVIQPFGLKMGIDPAHFGLELGMVFEGTMGVNEHIYSFNSKLVREEEKYTSSE